jgi:hypothetical protein
MVKNIPSENVTRGFPIVLPANHPDLIWLNANEVIITEASEDFEYQASPFKPLDKSLVVDPEGEELEDDTIDKVDLTDIESVTYTKYYDSVTKATKYKAVVKVRNSSLDKSNVRGVDARLYDPSGS